MKQRILLLSLALACISNAYASYPQTVTACVVVQGNTSLHHFGVGFGSTDYFDRGKWSSRIFSGMTCVSHTYSAGPKSISLGVGDSNDPWALLIRPDVSCPYIFNSRSGWAETGYMTTTDPEQNWTFTLTQRDPVGDYKDVFDMQCQHTGN